MKSPLRSWFLTATLLGPIGCTPASLSDAVRRQPDLKAQDHVVIIPISASSALGYRPVSLPREGGTDRISIEPKRCLIVPSTSISEANSVKSLKVEYTSNATLGAELKRAVASVGFDIANNDKATFELTDVKVQKALGIPDPSGPCGNFDASQNMVVIGAQVVAGTASLEFNSSLQATAQGSINNTGLKANAGAGTTQGTTINGSNLVIAAQRTPVSLEVKSSEIDLGALPAVNSYDFPLITNSGTATVESYSQSTQTLRVNAMSTIGSLNVPTGELVTCKAHQDLSLVGDSAISQCSLVFPGGSSMVSISWHYSEDSPRHIILRLRTFRTSYAP